jgi:hypothetical protein
MRSSLLSCAAAIAVAFCASSAQAAGALAYSFETGNDGFGPNGGGAYTQDTIGATEGTHSLKVAIPAGPTFVGGLTGNLAPSIGDPPGVDHILFDMTIVDPYAGNGFAVVGVSIFGCTQGGVSCGNQFQFADFEHIGGKAAGTYTDIRIDLDNSLHAHPITFVPNLPFNDIFGPNPGAPNDIIPTHFQLFFNQTGDAPVTVYIDNIRTVVPEPATGALFGLTAIALGMVARRRR